MTDPFEPQSYWSKFLKLDKLRVMTPLLVLGIIAISGFIIAVVALNKNTSCNSHSKCACKQLVRDHVYIEQSSFQKNKKNN